MRELSIPFSLRISYSPKASVKVTPKVLESTDDQLTAIPNQVCKWGRLYLPRYYPRQYEDGSQTRQIDIRRTLDLHGYGPDDINVAWAFPSMCWEAYPALRGVLKSVGITPADRSDLDLEYGCYVDVIDVALPRVEGNSPYESAVIRIRPDNPRENAYRIASSGTKRYPFECSLTYEFLSEALAASRPAE